ncbi:hypothetical protein GQ600_21951 [Phytophthora cactorum]|nr:hypothetical protein GQ600_21951 [Phytophthora cactorum]
MKPHYIASRGLPDVRVAASAHLLEDHPYLPITQQLLLDPVVNHYHLARRLRRIRADERWHRIITALLPTCAGGGLMSICCLTLSCCTAEATRPCTLVSWGHFPGANAGNPNSHQGELTPPGRPNYVTPAIRRATTTATIPKLTQHAGSVVS